jgi:serpin B
MSTRRRRLLLLGLALMGLAPLALHVPSLAPRACSFGVAPGAASAADPGADLAAVVRGNNEFAIDLYARLRQNEGNLFSSPYSISAALAMTYAGARGETAEQMAKVLHFGLDKPGAPATGRLGQDRLHPAFAELTRELNGHGLPRDYQLHVANSLWGEQRIPFLPTYQKLIKANYGSRIRPVDFVGQTEKARGLINRWVEEQTNDKIKDLLQRSDLDRLTRLVLVNAIYFKAAWEKPFEPEMTQKGVPFQVAAGKTVPVALMQQTGKFRYLDGDTFEVLELPYEGNELAMVVFLPRDKNGLAKFEESLTAAKLDGWLGRLEPRQVEVGLPRFKVGSRFELSTLLSEMGMPLAFRQDADFAGMTAAAKLFISKVIHQAFVDVNEEGTEAAAATAVVMRGAGRPEKGVVFRADHPFLFLLRDTRTGSILFLGRLTNPEAGGEGK